MRNNGSMSVATKLLLIEDNRAISDPLAQALQTTYDIDIAASAEQGMKRIEAASYDIIILELHLPDRSGLAVCEELRNRGIIAPVLVISTDAHVLTKIKLLDAGADDYLTKPFSLGELKARLRVLQRRAVEQNPAVSDLAVGELTLDRTSRQASRGGMVIDLRRKEFAILECLMLRAGTVVSREMLTRYAWDSTDDNWTNTIDVHIKYLRDKIDRPFQTHCIKTVHGLGYRLDPVGSTITPEALV